MEEAYSIPCCIDAKFDDEHRITITNCHLDVGKTRGHLSSPLPQYDPETCDAASLALRLR